MGRLTEPKWAWFGQRRTFVCGKAHFGFTGGPFGSKVLLFWKHLRERCCCSKMEHQVLLRKGSPQWGYLGSMEKLRPAVRISDASTILWRCPSKGWPFRPLLHNEAPLPGSEGLPNGRYPCPDSGPLPQIRGTPAGYYRLQDELPLTGGRRSAVPLEPFLARPCSYLVKNSSEVNLPSGS